MSDKELSSISEDACNNFDPKSEYFFRLIFLVLRRYRSFSIKAGGGSLLAVIFTVCS